MGLHWGGFIKMGRPFMIDLLFLSFVDSQAVECEQETPDKSIEIIDQL
jgi:hypothetical protein